MLILRAEQRWSSWQFLVQAEEAARREVYSWLLFASKPSHPCAFDQCWEMNRQSFTRQTFQLNFWHYFSPFPLRVNNVSALATNDPSQWRFPGIKNYFHMNFPNSFQNFLMLHWYWWAFLYFWISFSLHKIRPKDEINTLDVANVQNCTVIQSFQNI